MERFSPSIWSITLAKAQAELVNPEKSLVATICWDETKREGTDLPLGATVERARHRAQNPWAA